jgi:hypothetical protein
MEFDRHEERRRREWRKAQEEAVRKRAELQKAEQKARSARQRLLNTTKHENWHRMRLAAHDREVGYTGEMASARFYLRELPPREYFNTLLAFAQQMQGASLINVEVAAVRANLEDWTARGDALLLDRARRKYEQECASFEAWQAANPGRDDWRRKPATRAQWFLIARTADALGIATPTRLSCGEAHDWLTRHGGNLRLRRPEGDTEGEAA